MKRILLTFGVFVVIFVLVYGTMSGGFSLMSSRNDTSFDHEIAMEQSVQDSGIPQKWLDKYGIIARNEIDAMIDHDGDGLMLIDEYKYNTDPHNTDTDHDGYTDGQEVLNGYSPSGEGLMDQNDNGVPDMWEIENLGAIAGVDEDDVDGDGLFLIDEYVYGTDPQKSDTDGDGYSDGHEVQGGYDPGVPGDVRIKMTLKINAIGVETPVVLSQSTEESLIQKDLEKGVVHYPGTPLPGQRGNVYIAGHSSNYSWSKGSYNYVFKNLNDLVSDDVITLTQRLANGKEITHTYVVDSKEEVASDDARIFAQTQTQELTLTTCWPLGTSARRLMVKAYIADV